MQTSDPLRPVLEALQADGPATMFTLLARLNPRSAEGDASAWRQRQVELLDCFTRAHGAGHLESLPREQGQVTETFALTARGRDLLATDATRPFTRVHGERPADTPPPAVERRGGRWVLRGRTSVRIG